MDKRKPEEKPDEQPPGLLQLVTSVFAAAFGVQSSKNRERDFKHGKARIFIVSGILFVVLFGLTVFTLVRFVLSQSGQL